MYILCCFSLDIASYGLGKAFAKGNETLCGNRMLFCSKICAFQRKGKSAFHSSVHRISEACAWLIPACERGVVICLAVWHSIRSKRGFQDGGEPVKFSLFFGRISHNKHSVIFATLVPRGMEIKAIVATIRCHMSAYSTHLGINGAFYIVSVMVVGDA